MGESERKLARELFKLDVITRLEMGADCDAIAEEKGERPWWCECVCPPIKKDSESGYSRSVLMIHQAIRRPPR